MQGAVYFKTLWNLIIKLHIMGMSDTSLTLSLSICSATHVCKVSCIVNSVSDFPFDNFLY